MRVAGGGCSDGGSRWVCVADGGCSGGGGEQGSEKRKGEGREREERVIKSNQQNCPQDN